jgi:hypothetical protein
LKTDEEKKKLLKLKSIKKEVIDIKSSLETQHEQSHIVERKQKLQNSFNAITLETFVEKIKSIKTLYL